MAKRKGKIANQDNSGTAGLGEAIGVEPVDLERWGVGNEGVRSGVGILTSAQEGTWTFKLEALKGL